MTACVFHDFLFIFNSLAFFDEPDAPSLKYNSKKYSKTFLTEISHFIKRAESP